MSGVLWLHVYNGFFAKRATTNARYARYCKWTDILVEWMTTTKTETQILKDHGYATTSSFTGKSFQSRRLYEIQQFCKRENPALFEQCKRIHDNNR